MCLLFIFIVFCPLSVIASICAFIGAGKVHRTGKMDAKQFLITMHCPDESRKLFSFIKMLFFFVCIEKTRALASIAVFIVFFHHFDNNRDSWLDRLLSVQ